MKHYWWQEKTDYQVSGYQGEWRWPDQWVLFSGDFCPEGYFGAETASDVRVEARLVPRGEQGGWRLYTSHDVAVNGAKLKGARNEPPFKRAAAMLYWVPPGLAAPVDGYEVS